MPPGTPWKAPGTSWTKRLPARGVPYFTTAQSARMAVGALEALARDALEYDALQDAGAKSPPVARAG